MVVSAKALPVLLTLGHYNFFTAMASKKKKCLEYKNLLKSIQEVTLTQKKKDFMKKFHSFKCLQCNNLTNSMQKTLISRIFLFP